MVESWTSAGRMLVVLALMVVVDTEGPVRATPKDKLLQGPQGKAVLADILRAGGAGARREAELKRDVVAQSQLDVMRDVVALSQALEGELPLGGSRVPVHVFMAAGDKDCRNFFHEVLPRVLLKEGMFEIDDLKLVLWGSGKLLGGCGANLDAAGMAGLSDASSVELSCAGDPACAGNAWEACLVSASPHLEEYFPVLNCIEGRLCAEDEQAPAQCFGPVAEVAPVCARQFGEGVVDADALAECAKGSGGKALLLANAKATAALQPAPQFFPWILVDGKPLAQTFKSNFHVDFV